jgi:hypothetical protein
MISLSIFQPTTQKPKRSSRKQRSIIQQGAIIPILLLPMILFLLPFFFLSVTPAQAHLVDLSKGEGTTDQGLFNIPARQVATTTLEVEIVSSPWAILDNNNVASGPRVFVVEAVVSNTGINPATDVVVTLDYDDLANGWTLLNGEDPVRTIDSLASGTDYHAYWLASYPTSAGESHQYTVSASASNADSVATSTNSNGGLDPGETVKTRIYEDTGVSQLSQSVADVVVGVAFTTTIKFNLGSNPVAASFSPVGNLDFDAEAYRLLDAQVEFSREDGDPLLGTTVFDQLPIGSNELQV